MTGEMLISHLKSLSTSGIEKIEILTVPGAKRDASEASTIINLQRSERKTKGLPLASIPVDISGKRVMSMEIYIRNIL